jgi:hypothetical protein
MTCAFAVPGERGEGEEVKRREMREVSDLKVFGLERGRGDGSWKCLSE